MNNPGVLVLHVGSRKMKTETEEQQQQQPEPVVEEEERETKPPATEQHTVKVRFCFINK